VLIDVDMLQQCDNNQLSARLGRPLTFCVGVQGPTHDEISEPIAESESERPESTSRSLSVSTGWIWKGLRMLAGGRSAAEWAY